MNYSKIFADEISKAVQEGSYLGTGNPSGQILIVGKEVATDVEENQNLILEQQNLHNYNTNATDWLANFQNGTTQNEVENWMFDDPNRINNPLFAFKGAEIKEEGKTWRKYQKLHDFIYNKEENSAESKYVHNFQERLFITEMSDAPSKTTGKASRRELFKKSLLHRKNTFFKSDFIQNFPVVILACSDYITGNEIEEIFKVKFEEQKGENQFFWTHYNEHRSKLVIHTRQLSGYISNKLLLDVANEVKLFLAK